MTDLEALKRYAEWFRTIGSCKDRNVIDDALAELESLRARNDTGVEKGSKELPVALQRPSR